MPRRLAFRLTYGANIATYLKDGEIKAKNNTPLQLGYRISDPSIVSRRGGISFQTPCGSNINDFVPFYFSPATAMSFKIHRGEVPLVDPAGVDCGAASMQDVTFIVCDPKVLQEVAEKIWFSNIACNSGIMPNYEDDLKSLESHIEWPLFDESPKMGRVPELNYEGVCSWFHNRDRPEKYMNRKAIRMAEFLCYGAVPMDAVEALVIKDEKWKDYLQFQVDRSNFDIPIIINSGCYF